MKKALLILVKMNTIDGRVFAIAVKQLKCNAEEHTVTECEQVLGKDKKENETGGTNEVARQ